MNADETQMGSHGGTKSPRKRDCRIVRILWLCGFVRESSCLLTAKYANHANKSGDHPQITQIGTDSEGSNLRKSAESADTTAKAGHTCRFHFLHKLLHFCPTEPLQSRLQSTTGAREPQRDSHPLSDISITSAFRCRRIARPPGRRTTRTSRGRGRAQFTM
jgi:hypothetical protein